MFYSMIPATSIKQVLEQLDLIIEETILENNYLGVFAYVYRRTTAKIEEAIKDGRFEDNDRMEKMDVIFANLYIKAYYDYKLEKTICNAWKTSFELGNKKISLVQHLMLGMNAHINYDLGQAAALCNQGDSISSLKNDFMEVNYVLAELTDVMQKKLGKVSPMMFLLDWIGHRSDERLTNFSMKKARDFAWRLAEDLAQSNEKEKEKRIKKADKNVTRLSNILARPPGISLKIMARILSFSEEKNVGKVIEILSRD